MEWNYNGSLIACTSKDKNFYICDPRNGEITLKNKGHESPKTMKMTWIDEFTLITTGFKKANTREMKLWDTRNIKDQSPKETYTIDHQSGIPTPYFDKDLKILFVFGRGEGNMHYYDLNEGNIRPCNDYLSSEPTTSVVMFEKKCMDYNKCELDRFAKYTGKTIQYLSFYYPKRVPEFEEALYPPTFSGEAALSLNEWVSGTNKEPLKKDIRKIENKWVSEVQSFEKKIEEPKVVISPKSSNAELEKKVEELSNRVKELESENKILKDELEKIKSGNV